MEQIFLPSTIEFLDTDRPNVGQMVITPCHQGYGTTLGNALRRVLLSSLPGAAVESVKITGVQHEFSVIENVEEDVIEVLLNLKQMAVRSHADQPVVLTLTKKGKGPVYASGIDKNADVEIMNPDLLIATITDSSKTLEMEITVGKGRGYVPVSEKDTKNLDLGRIAIDSLYTPIRDIGYNVEMTRVGDVTDYEKLTLTIETNGTVSPKEAVNQATKILIDHFSLILDRAEAATMPNVVSAEASSAADADDAVSDEAKEEKVESKKTSKSKKKKAE